MPCQLQNSIKLANTVTSQILQRVVSLVILIHIYHLFLVSLHCYFNNTHPSNHSHLSSLRKNITNLSENCREFITNNYELLSLRLFHTFILKWRCAVLSFHSYLALANATSTLSSFERFLISDCKYSSFVVLFMEYTIRGNVKTVRRAAVVTASDAHHGMPVYECTSSSKDCAAPIGGQLGDKNWS